MALYDHRWAFQPVDPSALYYLLRESLNVGVASTEVKPMEIVTAPMPDVSATNFRDQYLLREVLRKYPGFDLGIDTRKVALDAFYADETTNSLTNDRLLSELPQGAIGQVLHLSRKKIAEILGRFDEGEFWASWRFGPHSTVSLKRHEATIDKKLMLTSPTCTVGAIPLFRKLLSENAFWAYTMGTAIAGKPVLVDFGRIKVCQYDRWESVRKNARTDRGIGIPPDGNVLMQLAGGKMLRRRLYKAGINLNDQVRNQKMARNGSITGASATVDVRSASQSVTCGLVWNQIGSQSHMDLDPRWYMMLEALRTPYTLVEGKLHENELFSAMGNGYTFELESLLFYALAWACTSYLHEDTHAVSVYGDDIILPVGAYGLLTQVFEFCGFRINEDKSFATTGNHRFRESCGKHYLNGVDVTPFYVDEDLNSPFQIILLANNLRRWASNGHFCDGRLYHVWLWVLSHLGEGYRERGIPYGEANDGLIMDWDEACPSSVSLRSKGRFSPTHVGYKAMTVDFIPRARTIDDETRYLRWQYHNSGHSGFKPPAVPLLGGRTWKTWPHWSQLVEPSLNVVPEPPRAEGAKVALRLGSRVVTSWTNAGPWVTEDVVDPVSVRIALVLLGGQRELTRMPPGLKPKRSKKR
jgi:hypothetical protein